MRVQVRSEQRTHRRDREEDRADQQTRADDRSHLIAEGLEDILDEIDALLEHNAEEFLQNFVQKGGE